MMNMMPGTCPTSDGGGPGTPSSAMMEAVEVDRYCKVCGDKAVYVNYGALTCDSCKTFFRRQNLHPKRLSCNYSESCFINAKTRKDCTKCRLIKCFKVGMRSDVIGSATNEKIRKQQIFNEDSDPYHQPQDHHPQRSPVPLPHLPESDMLFQSAQHPPQLPPVQPLSTLHLPSRYPSFNVQNHHGPPQARFANSFQNYQRRIPVTSMVTRHEPKQTTTQHNQPQLSQQNDINIQEVLEQERDDGMTISLSSESSGSDASVEDVTQKTVGMMLDDQLRITHPPVVTKTSRVMSSETEVVPFSSVSTSSSCKTSRLEQRQQHQNIPDVSISEEEGAVGGYTDIPPALYRRKQLTAPDRVLRQNFLPETIIPLHHIKTPFCYLSKLSDDESVQMNQVKQAAAAMRARVFVSNDTSRKPIVAAMKLQKFGVDKMIAGVSTISAFGNLNERLKESLLRGSCAEMMLCRSTMHFDPAKKGWTVQALGSMGGQKAEWPASLRTWNQTDIKSETGTDLNGISFNLSIEMFQELNGDPEWIKDYFTFASLLDQSWKEDEILITILIILILFNPEHADLESAKEIKYQNRLYQFLLKRYLETSCKTLADASEAFNRLKFARQLCRRLKDSFESLVLRLTSEDFKHLNGRITALPDVEIDVPKDWTTPTTAVTTMSSLASLASIASMESTSTSFANISNAMMAMGSNNSNLLGRLSLGSFYGSPVESQQQQYQVIQQPLTAASSSSTATSSLSSTSSLGSHQTSAADYCNRVSASSSLSAKTVSAELSSSSTCATVASHSLVERMEEGSPPSVTSFPRNISRSFPHPHPPQSPHTYVSDFRAVNPFQQQHQQQVMPDNQDRTGSTSFHPYEAHVSRSSHQQQPVTDDQ